MTKEEFISECMVKLKDKFPDQQQRLAVCFSKWERGDTKFQANTDEVKKLLVFPRGKFYFDKYKEWFNFDDDFFTEIKKSFNNSVLPKPFVDINHRQDESYGNIIDLEITQEGLYFYIIFNEKGKELLKNNEYQYISPSFGEIVDINGEKHRWYCDSISLTNIPAFLNTIPKIQEQITLNKGVIMKKIKDLLITKFKLTAETDAAVEDLVIKLLEEGQAKEEILKSLQTKVEQLTKELEEAKAKEQEAVETLEKERKFVKEKEIEDFLLENVKNKKLQANQTDFWRELSRQDFEKVKKYFANVKTEDGVGYTFLNTDLSAEEVEIAKMCGYDLNNSKHLAKLKEIFRKGGKK